MHWYPVSTLSIGLPLLTWDVLMETVIILIEMFFPYILKVNG